MADNGLRFQIRHGKTIPENGELKTYELGYLYGTGALYMGTSSGCRRLIPPGLGDHDAYLPLTGGTLTSSVHIRPTTTTDYKVFSVSRQMNFSDDTNYYVNAMAIARDTDNKLVRGSLMLYRKSSLEGIINDNNIISSLKFGLDTEGVSNAWVSGKLLLNSSNYSNYALPKSGGTLTGDLIISPTTITNSAYVSIRKKIDTTYYRSRMYVSSKGFTILDNSISTNNSDWTQKGYLAVGESGGVIYGSVNGDKILTAANYDEYALPLSGGTLTGTLTLPKIRLTGTGDASLTSTAHALQIGETSEQNIIIDDNEIISRKNGESTTLYINVGGTTSINSILTTSISLHTAGSAVTATDVNGKEWNILYNVQNSNKNIQLNSTNGDIFIGWENTTGIRLGCNTNCPIRLGTGAYGTSLPSSGLEGQIFFKLES